MSKVDQASWPDKGLYLMVEKKLKSFATEEDLIDLAQNMRLGDMQECLDSHVSPLQALQEASLSPHAWGLWKDDVLLGVWGVDPESGVVWSLWRDLSVKDSVYILKRTEEWVRRMQGLAKRRLFNYTRSDNEPAMLWIKGCGQFRFNPKRDFWVGNVRYRYFEYNGDINDNV